MNPLNKMIDHPNRARLSPFLGRTFTKKDGTDPCTASNLTMWDLIKKFTTDLVFQESVKNKLDAMAKKCEDPFRCQHLKTKEKNFRNIVNNLLNDIQKTKIASVLQQPIYSDIINDDYHHYGYDDYLYDECNMPIISWEIDCEAGYAYVACPIFNKDLTINRDGTCRNYYAIIFNGIVDQKALIELGENGFMSTFIFGHIDLPKPLKTLQQMVMDKYTHGFDKFKLDSHIENDSHEQLMAFVNSKINRVPSLVLEDAYFRRQLPEKWQRILWTIYDDDKGYHATYDPRDPFGPEITRSWYRVIEGVNYTIRIIKNKEQTCIDFKYNNDFQIIDTVHSKPYKWTL